MKKLRYKVNNDELNTGYNREKANYRGKRECATLYCFGNKFFMLPNIIYINGELVCVKKK